MAQRRHSRRRSCGRQKRSDLQQPFKRALVISLLNPKAILFLLSFFVQFIDPGYDTPAVPFLILSAIIMVFSAMYLSAPDLCRRPPGRRFRRREAAVCQPCPVLWVACLSGSALKLATASLN